MEGKDTVRRSGGRSPTYLGIWGLTPSSHWTQSLCSLLSVVVNIYATYWRTARRLRAVKSGEDARTRFSHELEPTDTLTLRYKNNSGDRDVMQRRSAPDDYERCVGVVVSRNEQPSERIIGLYKSRGDFRTSGEILKAQFRLTKCYSKYHKMGSS